MTDIRASSLAMLLGIATLSGGVVGALAVRQWESIVLPAHPIELSPHSKGFGTNASQISNAATAADTVVYLPAVAPRDVDAALDTMGLGPEERQKLRNDLAETRLQLLWLTLWDWDTETESGNTISIVADDYQRRFTLSSHRTRIAIPEPHSGRITLRGEVTEDGIIAISFLSGKRPIAIPYMRVGDTVSLLIDRP